jgi:hypothetical protein
VVQVRVALVFVEGLAAPTVPNAMGSFVAVSSEAGSVLWINVDSFSLETRILRRQPALTALCAVCDGISH